MEQVVVDASVAIKWVFSEELSPTAVGVRTRFRLIAPALLLAECANILWKKVRRKELLAEEAKLLGAALHRSGVDLTPLEDLAAGALDLSLKLNHPAYDCFYLELCRIKQLRLITADEKLLRRLDQADIATLPRPISLRELQ